MGLRVVFVGCVTFSKVTLLKLLDLHANVVAVVTKDKSSFNADFEDLSEIASERSIPFKYVNDINHVNNVAWIGSFKPDVILCFGWSNLLKKEILELSTLGVVGYHPSLLPHNRGRHPLIWAKVLGLEKTGSTFFFMDEGADSGDIISQVEIPLQFEDSAADIYGRMTQTALDQIESFLPLLSDRTFERRPQPRSAGNVWRKRSMIDGLVDFRMTTTAICNLVRALSKPYPGAHCVCNGNNVKIWTVEPGAFSGNNIEPGKVLSINNTILEVKTGDGSIRIIDHEFSPLPETGSYLN